MTISSLQLFDISSTAYLLEAVLEADPEENGSEHPQQTFQHLHPALDEVTAQSPHHQASQQLENTFAVVEKVLDSLKAKFQSYSSEMSCHWLEKIDDTAKQLKTPSTIIGVVGATGAGKSSLINSLLDQEHLLPTSCMQACTAAVVEISYNHQGSSYRAEIEFLSAEEWSKELEVSLRDLLDSSGKLPNHIRNEASEAGVAYAKLEAVYPSIVKGSTQDLTLDKLLAHDNVRNHLGRCLNIEHSEALSFSNELAYYVGSKKRPTRGEFKIKLEENEPVQVQLWPLIRVVRLFVEAPMLQTGAVIVDLPGVHDTNHARVEVAQRYLEQCTRLWILAPITRAVSERSAKTLLGDAMRRQLKMDNGYNTVTFICSKTDDIHVKDVKNDFPDDEEISGLQMLSKMFRKQEKNLRTRPIASEHNRHDIMADHQTGIVAEANTDVQRSKLAHDLQSKAQSAKRRHQQIEVSRKRPRYVEDSDGDLRSDEDSENDCRNPEETRVTINDGHVDSTTSRSTPERLAKLNGTDTKECARSDYQNMPFDDIERRLAIIKMVEKAINLKLLETCINRRNEASSTIVQEDFASGSRELNDRMAEEADPANFDPENNTHNTVAAAESLPVFCVSSRAYQKLRGHLQPLSGISGFRRIEKTQIPALQEHCQKLTAITRAKAYDRLTTDFNTLLIRLRLWATSTEDNLKLAHMSQEDLNNTLKSGLKILKTAFKQNIKTACDSIQDEIEHHLCAQFSRAINFARFEAESIQAGWGRLCWSTYKATAGRDGSFKGNNFNRDLAEPFCQHIAPTWSRTFSPRLPHILACLSANVCQSLSTFHDELEQRISQKESSMLLNKMREKHLPDYKAIINKETDIVVEIIGSRQKRISRTIEPQIAMAMLPAYCRAAAEAGPGMFSRMKTTIQSHVKQVKHGSYDAACSSIQNRLMEVSEDAKDRILAGLEQIRADVKDDYRKALIRTPQNTDQDRELLARQHELRREILEIIDKVEKISSGCQSAQ